jgi:hypothetical protein
MLLLFWIVSDMREVDAATTVWKVPPVAIVTDRFVVDKFPLLP